MGPTRHYSLLRETEATIKNTGCTAFFDYAIL